MNSNVKLTASVVSLSAGAVGLGVAVASLLGIQSGAYAATPESYSSVNWTGLLSLLPTGAGIWGIVSTFLKSANGQVIVDTVVNTVRNTKLNGKLDQKSLVSIVEDMARNLVEASGTDAGDIPETAALSTLWAMRNIKGDVDGAKLVTDLADHIRKHSSGVKK